MSVHSDIVLSLDWFNLVQFYGISTILDYLMPNAVYTYILNILFVNTLYLYQFYKEWKGS